MSKKIKNILWYLSIISCIAILVYCGLYYYNYIKDEEAVVKILSESEEFIDNSKSESRYSDVHLRVDETLIDYDIMQGEDNEYYLWHTADGSYNKAGWLFYDYRVKADSKNKIIYGHNRVTGIMFGSLSYLTSFSYYDKYGRDVIHLWQGNEESTYRVFSVYVTSTDFDYLQCDFSDSSEFIKYIEKIQEKNSLEVLNNEVISEDSEIITLSTCAGTNRLVVHGVKI